MTTEYGFRFPMDNGSKIEFSPSRSWVRMFDNGNKQIRIYAVHSIQDFSSHVEECVAQNHVDDQRPRKTLQDNIEAVVRFFADKPRLDLESDIVKCISQKSVKEIIWIFNDSGSKLLLWAHVDNFYAMPAECNPLYEFEIIDCARALPVGDVYYKSAMPHHHDEL